MSHKDLEIKINPLTRVEGEGGLDLSIVDGKIDTLKLRIYEAPRFIEGILRGRHYHDVLDIVSRICGICPVAYIMSASHALESILGIHVEPSIRLLRRLFYCAEWIESHILHIYFLAAPDFLGYDSAISMAKDHPKLLERGLRLKKVGNDLLAIIGGRSVHPVSARVGGFYRILNKSEFSQLLDPLRIALEDAVETVKWVSTFDIPSWERDIEFVSLYHPNEYPLNEGRIRSTKGIDIEFPQFNDYFREEHVEYSAALHSFIVGRGSYFVGPLARTNINFEKLSDLTKDVAGSTGINFPNSNPFLSIVARALEVIHVIDEAINIIENYVPPDKPYIDLPSKEGIGFWATEAPRGLLYHSYRIDQSGKILEANIIPPTAQNQKHIEGDLLSYLSRIIPHSSKEVITHEAERIIRNYDPCISCATHFLKLNISRT